MNKLLLSTICAAALTTGASAFTLDLSSLNGSTLGTGSITNSYGTFNFSAAAGSATVTNGQISLLDGKSLTIAYPSTVVYSTSTITGSVILEDLPANNTIKYTAAGGDIGIKNVTFNPVPEPSSTALLGLGGLALILRRRK